MSAPNSNEQPSLIGGHAQYVKGAAEELVGKATGAETWKSSGTEGKQQGISAMKAASEQRDSSSQGLGKVEELAGKAAGCEGMVQEGQESKSDKQ